MMKKYYKAQALAIVMVVLVVASIIGVSLFSRMSKDRDSVINQQDSALAQEQSDGILDIFVGADIDVLEDELGDGALSFENISDGGFADFVDFVGGDSNALPDENVGCLEDSSSILVTIDQTDEDDFIEIQPGSVRVYNLEGATTIVDPCNLTWRFKAVSESAAFLIEYITDDEVEVTQEAERYCIGPCVEIDGVEYLDDFLGAGDEFDGIPDSDGARPRTINLLTRFNNHVIEIRIIPLAGTLAVADSLTSLSCIDKEFRSIKVRSEVNCNGSYRGKEMFLPGSGSLGYSPLFDYAVYDGGFFLP